MSLKRIGAGALDYDFGALDDADNPFTKSYTNLVYDRLSLFSMVQGPCHANSLSYSSVSPPSGDLLDPSFSSHPLRDDSPGCFHGYTITPAIVECRFSDRTRTRGALSLGN